MNGRSFLIFWIHSILVVFAVNAAQRTQNFDSDPGWTGIANLEAGQNYGYSADTQFAGGVAAGEAGGTMERLTSSYYADVTEALDPSSTFLQASGRVAMRAGDGNILFGWFRHETYAGNWSAAPADLIGIETNNALDIYACFKAGGTVLREQGPVTVQRDVPFEYILTFDPDANSGLGVLTLEIKQLDGTSVGSTFINLQSGQKDLIADLNRFGFVSLNTSSSTPQELFIDDFEYTASIGGATPTPTPTPPPLVLVQRDVSFDNAPYPWEEFNNRTEPQNFGFSLTNNAGGVAGEAGGTVSGALGAYYAERFTAIDAATHALSASFKIRSDQGSRVFVGWMNRAEYVATGRRRMLGVQITAGLMDAVVGSSLGGHILQTAELLSGLPESTLSVQITYDPAANSGNGQMVVTVSGGATANATIDLQAENKEQLPALDLFGMFAVTGDAGGLGQVWIDDLSYTAPELPNHAYLVVLSLAGN